MEPQNAVQTHPGLEVALAMWHRQKWLALLVFVTLLSATAAVARSLPDTYESTATVLVEHEQTGGLADRLAADDLETRLRAINEQILGRSRLYELVTRSDLFPELRQRATPEAVAEQMRRDIKIQFNGVRQSSGLERTITISLSYRGHDPQAVAQVANALAALYLETNARITEQQTAGTTEFLRAQLENAKRNLDAQERQILAFKERHISELPEQQVANLAALGRLNTQLRSVMDQEETLTREELNGVAVVPGGTGGPTPTRLAQLRRQLADLRTRYTDEYPDVIRVKQEIADLERPLATQGGSAAVAEDSPVPQLQDSRAVAMARLTPLRNEEKSLRTAIATYEERIENAPLIEQALQQLSQGYADAKALYQLLLQRHQEAQLTEQMQQRLRGEQFRILDPAVPSRQPVAPHRSRLIFMGLMAAVAAAIGAVLLAEANDTSFHTVGDVRAFTSVPVLVSIPPIVTRADIRRRRRQFTLAILVAALGIAAVAGASSYFIRSYGGLVMLLLPGSF